MDAPILETERLVFRPFTPDDLPLIVDLHSDPEVQRYMGGTWSNQEMRDTLDRFVRQQAAQGHAKWAAFLCDGTFVGRAGVGSFPPLAAGGFGGDMEIGYCFKAEYWGGGFATEAAHAIVAWFFANTPHDRLFGFTEPGNAASQKVLLKIGMTPMGSHDLGFDEPSALFRMMRP
jgi:ribosomal-protein-alanine N-acetyltransferase